MTLTEQQRKKIVELVEHDINESQSSTRYWFDHDEVTLIWVNDDEVYYALKKDGTAIFALTRANWNIRIRAFK